MVEEPLNERRKTARALAALLDARPVAHDGPHGYRKSTVLGRLVPVLEELDTAGFLDATRSVFCDLGCADGRVSLLAACFARRSLGLELDPDILAEAAPLREEALSALAARGLPPPPGEVALLQGDSLAPETLGRLRAASGVAPHEIDLFYTYITLHEEFARLIAGRGRPGALYLVYGFSRVLPRYEGLEVLIPDCASQGIAALYRKAAP